MSRSRSLTSDRPIGYVNAQFRFVMNPTGNYAAHFTDPDLYVARFCPLVPSTSTKPPFLRFFPWQQILQVIVPTTSALALAEGHEPSSRSSAAEGMTCPICLGHPIAPRMTKCGHVRSLAFPCCFLQLISFSARTDILLPLYPSLLSAVGHP